VFKIPLGFLTNKKFTYVNFSVHAQNTAGGERSEHATGLLTGGPPAVFDIFKQPACL
jgi:hypothetical protein